MQRKLIMIFCAVMFLGTSLFLTGCQDKIDLEDRNYIMGLGIDLEDRNYVFTFGFPDLEALTGNGENIHYPVTQIHAASIEEATKLYGNRSNKRLDYGQLQTIVFGESLLQDEAMMKALLLDMKERQEFARTILVCMAEDRAEEIIYLDESVNGAIGVYIRDMFENNHILLGYDKITLNDLIIGISNPQREIRITSIHADDEEGIPVMIGNKVIKGFTLE